LTVQRSPDEPAIQPPYLDDMRLYDLIKPGVVVFSNVKPEISIRIPSAKRNIVLLYFDGIRLLGFKMPFSAMRFGDFGKDYLQKNACRHSSDSKGDVAAMLRQNSQGASTLMYAQALPH
jgi:hypothetical protein